MMVTTGELTINKEPVLILVL